MEDERLRLRPAEATVRADQLLERGHFAEHRVVLAEQQQVGGVDHGVLALEAHDRVRAEQGRRVLALDPVLVEEARPIRAEDHGPELLRADSSSPDARVGRDRGDESRVELLELLDRESVVVPGEPHQPEIARADDRDRRRIGDGGGSSSTSSRLTVPSASVLLASAARATVGPTPLARGDLRQERVHEGRPLGLGLGLDDRRAAAHQLADVLAEADAVSLEECLAEALAVIGQDDELVRPGRLIGRLDAASRWRGRRRRAPRAIRRAPGRSGGRARRSR